jgi:hypothetical protein
VLAAAVLGVATATLPVLAQTGAPGDSGRAALEAELDRMLAHLEPVEQVDPFAAGRRPDLIVVSTATLRGETAPCG